MGLDLACGLWQWLWLFGLFVRIVAPGFSVSLFSRRLEANFLIVRLVILTYVAPVHSAFEPLIWLMHVRKRLIPRLHAELIE